MLSSREQKLESEYQHKVLMPLLRENFPGAFILKNDTRYRQGIPDLTVLYQDRWAFLEVKASEDSPYQPNQEYYLAKADRMSFGRTIHPTNQDEVIHDMLVEWGVI